MRIALSTPRFPRSVEDALETIERMTAEAAAREARIICFPEAYLPGYRGLEWPVADYDAAQQERALARVAEVARRERIGIVLGMEWIGPSGNGAEGRHLAAGVFGLDGTLLGIQTKNQLDPTEDALYVPGRGRRLFEIDGLKFGVVICHEGFRYPETVRWAATRGAAIVFHPYLSGSDREGSCPTEFAARGGAYYEQAMLMRSRENTIYFASVNYAVRYPDAATCLIAPSGECAAYQPYGEEGVLVCDIDPAAATGLLARRFAPGRYGDDDASRAEPGA